MNELVIKYGGNAMKSMELRQAIAKEIAALKTSKRVVVVHGGGPVIEAQLAQLGIPSQFLRGLRVTSPEAMAVIERAITTLSKELSQEIGQAIGLTGRDDKLMLAEVLSQEYGRVGEVKTVNQKLLLALLDAGYTPVLGCIATEETGEALNINADWAAGAVAGALAAPIVFLTDVPGVLRDPKDTSTLIAKLNRQETQDLIASGVISGGMIPKVESAINALAKGAPRAVIASGMQAGVLERAAQFEAGTTLVP